MRVFLFVMPTKGAFVLRDYGPVWHRHAGPHQSLVTSMDAEIQPYARPVIVRPVVVRLVVAIIRLFIIIVPIGIVMMPTAAPVVIAAIAHPSLPMLPVIDIHYIAIIDRVNLHR